jgi:hypothetical protein
MHSLGIPHPPGTPLYILIGNVWGNALAPLTTFAIAINALSSVTTATGCALFANLFHRWTRDPLAAWAAAVCAGATSTLWLNATETEVYSSAFCLAALVLWTANRAAETHNPRWTVLTAYLIGLGWALHLTALLTVPAALILIATTKFRKLKFAQSAVSIAIGASAVLFLIVRAQHDPAINQGNPTTWPALWDVLQRHQYTVAPMWPRRAPLWLQLGNIIEYADWQFALGLASNPGPALWRTPITIAFAVFGVLGSLTHRRIDKRSWRAMLVLFLTATLGVAIYLNLLTGPSFGIGVLPPTALHEARERDYFFTLGFVCWALWAGYGLIAVSRRYGKPWPTLAVVMSCIPIATNWNAIHHERSTEQQRADQESRAMLHSVPPNGIFLAIGDNDTYPLWYLQQAEGYRPDVTVVTIPLLGAPWYRAELQRRHHLLTPAYVAPWRGTDQPPKTFSITQPN